jgi:6-phosphogluconate dehydrogenase
MKRGLAMDDKEIGDVFTEWNKGVLDSFLIEITRDIMYKNDDKDGSPIVEKILDSAGQKGTGKWTAINALDLGMPVTLIGEAVFARCLSSLKAERGRASKLLDGPTPSFSGDKKQFLANLEQALYASKIISYAQGFMLIQNVSTYVERAGATMTNKLKGCKGVQMEAEQARNRPHVAWRMHHSISLPQGHYQGVSNMLDGKFCSVLTKRLSYRANPDLENLLFDDFFNKAIHTVSSSDLHKLSATNISPGSTWLERRCQQGSPVGYSHSRFQHRVELLRRLPFQGSARKPSPSPARLLRRPHFPRQARTRQR